MIEVVKKKERKNERKKERMKEYICVCVYMNENVRVCKNTYVYIRRI